jgi:hypothetical protein
MSWKTENEPFGFPPTSAAKPGAGPAPSLFPIVLFSKVRADPNSRRTIFKARLENEPGVGYE